MRTDDPFNLPFAGRLHSPSSFWFILSLDGAHPPQRYWERVSRSRFLRPCMAKNLEFKLKLIFSHNFERTAPLPSSLHCCLQKSEAILIPDHFFKTFIPPLFGNCDLSFTARVLKSHGTVPWHGPIFIHCAGILMASFNLETHVLQF